MQPTLHVYTINSWDHIHSNVDMSRDKWSSKIADLVTGGFLSSSQSNSAHSIYLEFLSRSLDANKCRISKYAYPGNISGYGQFTCHACLTLFLDGNTLFHPIRCSSFDVP